MTLSASVLGLEKILEIRGRREEQGAMQDICLRTFIAVFHLGAYFAHMLPGEVHAPMTMLPCGGL